MSKKILLVEDEALIAMSEAQMLKKHGFEVVSVYNGEKAVEAIDSDPDISLILMDIDLGKGMDGTDAAEEILEKKDIPIVFLSSHTEAEVVEKTEGITSYGYIVKNSGETVLLASIRMAFRLWESEDKYHSVFKTTMDAILLVDKETGRIIDANPAAEKMYGYTREELLHLKPWDMSAEPEDTRVMIQEFESDNFTVNERIHTRRDGTPFNVEICASQFTMGERQIRLGTLHDISERKRIEAELRQSEERARAVIETAEDSIFIKDKSGVYTMVNPAMEKLFGREAQDILGKTDYGLFGEEAGKAVSKADKDVYEGKTLEEFPAKPINGTPHTFHTIKVPLHDFEDNITGLCGIARDITERTQAEELLKKRNARLHKINQYSIELGFLRYDELYPYIVKKLKDIFKTSTAWVSEYDEKTSHLVVKSTSLSDKENSWVVKKLGEKVIGYKTRVNEEHYKMMRNVKVGKPQTLYEISFGAIPENIAILIEKGLHLEWFMTVAFINKDTISGTAVIAGKPGEEAPNREEILAFAGITGEVIRRKRAEEKLAAKKELLENITVNMFDLVALTDIDGTYTFISKSHSGLGYDITHLLGKSVFAYIHPEDITQVKASFNRIMRSDETEGKEEFRYRGADGSYIWLESVGKKLLGEEGEVKELLFSSRDITERKEAERENFERKQYLEVILNTTPSAIVTLDSDNRISEWNKGAEDLFGYTKEEVVGKRIDDLITGKDEEIHKNASTITNKVQAGETIPPTEGVRYTREGALRDVIIAGSPIMVDNTFQGSIGTYIDITPLKQKENRVQELLKEKEQLLREVHHRIKNHMNTIAAIISLRKSHVSDSPINAVLDELHNKIRLMQNIYQTLYTGNEVGTIHINSFLGQLLYDIQSTYIKEPSIQIKTDIEDIEVTSKQSLPIGIIVTELITNAIKCAFEGREEGTISISINKTDEDWLKIQVADNGTGLSDMIIENKSYGFGLTLVDGYVRQYDGEMSIDNSHGTNITITMNVEE
ncbi:MAG: PAS domain S-box protein [Spirochaetia bacterium]|nr:PAS domain S-box protein [Spirochaetia bacterium]